MLEREEYIEQAHFFRALGERMEEQMPLQEVLAGLRDEALSTTKLPLAIDFMMSELRHQGVFGPAMKHLNHYFTPFQTYLTEEAESEQGRFDMRLAFEILHQDAKYHAVNDLPQGVFIFAFEILCRNRLSYDRGLEAIANDPIFDEKWREWILTVRRQMGIVDFSDMIYVRSEYYQLNRIRRGLPRVDEQAPVLFGEKEGKIAWANRRKDPLYLFSALQRQLGYPEVTKPKKPEDASQLPANILRRLERLETRIKLVEDEAQGGIDLTNFYEKS